MTKLRLSIVLAAIAMALYLTAAVLLVPVIISGESTGLSRLGLPAVIFGLLLTFASGTLRRQAKAAAHQADGA